MTTTTQPEAVGYSAIHKRLAAEMGPAWSWECAECGEGASDWAYDHGDADERLSGELGSMGMPYSLHSSHYRPLCRRCHRRVDAEHAAREEVRMTESFAVHDGESWEGRTYPREAMWDFKRLIREAQGHDDEPVHDLRELIHGHAVAQEDEHLDIVTLWAAGTYLVARGIGSVFPRLAIVAPSMGAGKSTLLETAKRCSHNGELIDSAITDALIPRLLRANPGAALFFDECDKTLDPSKVGATAILNSGWSRGRTAWINMKSGEDWVPTAIDVFAPVAFAGNGVKLAPDLRQRTIQVRLKHAEGVTAPDWAGDMAGVDDRLRVRLEAWADRVAERRLVRRPVMPDGLHARDADRWSVLMSVAYAIGGAWPSYVAGLALRDRDEREAEREAIGRGPNEQLAHDLAEVWDARERFTPTSVLVERLHAHNPDMWGDRAARDLTAMALGGKLRNFYGVESMRGEDHAGRRVRGYSLADVSRAWRAVGIELKYGEDGPSWAPVRPEAGVTRFQPK